MCTQGVEPQAFNARSTLFHQTPDKNCAHFNHNLDFKTCELYRVKILAAY